VTAAATAAAEYQPVTEPAPATSPTAAGTEAPSQSQKTPELSLPGLLANGSRQGGLVTGGVGVAFIASGAVAGGVALLAYQAEVAASASGDLTGYHQSRDGAKSAIVTSNVLYGIGAVVLGAGAYLFFKAPGEVSVGAGVSPGKASLTVGGHF
jgi:hypothetical protein